MKLGVNEGVGVVRAPHTHQQERPTLPNAQDRFLLPVHRVWWSGLFVCRARATHNNTDQHKHRHVTTPKGAKRLLKMACNKVCMTARCVYEC